MSTEEFEKLAEEGKIGHVGLVESAAFVADALKLEIDSIEEELLPAIAQTPIKTEFLKVDPGQVAGIMHSAWGKRSDEVVVQLVLHMYLGAESPRDEIVLTARPPMRIVVKGGTPGDFATVAALLNAVPRIIAAPPGLLTLAQVPPV